MVNLRYFVTRYDGRDAIQSHMSLYADISPTQDWYDRAYRKVLQIHSSTWKHHRTMLGVIGRSLFDDRPSFAARENAPVTESSVVLSNEETVDDSISRLARDLVMTKSSNPQDFVGVARLSTNLQYQIAQMVHRRVANPLVRLILVDCFDPDDTTVIVGLNRT